MKKVIYFRGCSLQGEYSNQILADFNLRELPTTDIELAAMAKAANTSEATITESSVLLPESIIQK